MVLYVNIVAQVWIFDVYFLNMEAMKFSVLSSDTSIEVRPPLHVTDEHDS